MKNRTQWQWYAWGKHPGLEDFVWAGMQTPLFQRFTKWVDNGFARLNTDSKLRSRHCSWRFWTRGAGHQIVCGLVRNSCDTHGRSFPLLYVGAGGLEDWMRNCSMLPFAFESIWKSFEYAASARFDNLRQLNEALQLIQQPEPQWRTYQQRIYNRAELSAESGSKEAVEDGRRLLLVDCGLPENLPFDLRFCRRVMSMGDDQSPLAVFIGEIEDRIAVTIIDRILTPADFVWLWTLDQTQPAQPRRQPQRGSNDVAIEN